ncbi:MAG TPA: MarR family transcriptional regulator [Gemmataceae bacterium]|jgi:MarR family 2-MHQ and catechol resistance regulon transcriptional repressor|nr:MarR family transcriptional regulator [Gemmataceae bacterium]
MPIANSHPAVDSSATRAFREFLRVFGLVERAMQPYFARFGISGSQWGVLRNLFRAETEGATGLRVSVLSERLLIRPASVTGVVDRLERAGLVARESDPTDHRAKFVRLTKLGRQLVERVLASHQRQIEDVFGGLKVEEQMRLHGLLMRLGEHLESLTDTRIRQAVS